MEWKITQVTSFASLVLLLSSCCSVLTIFSISVPVNFSVFAIYLHTVCGAHFMSTPVFGVCGATGGSIVVV